MATASLLMQVYFLLFRYSALIQTLFEPFKGLISEIMKKKYCKQQRPYPLLFYFHFLNALTVLAFDLHFGVCSFLRLLGGMDIFLVPDQVLSHMEENLQVY